MPCFTPLEAYIGPGHTKNGKRVISFSPRDGFADLPIKLPCGQCIGCRLDRSRQWAIRCLHESQQHEDNCFVTLTYSEENLPPGGTLVPEHMQLFFKRLRKRLQPKKIRYFHAGEYGEQFNRPHYHAIIFGHDFRNGSIDQTVSDCKNINGTKLYTSKTLDELWPYGYNTVGDCNFESAAYVARYCLKKITGKDAVDHYIEADFDTGEILTERKPEYCTMSRRPGIGREYVDKYAKEILQSDSIIINGMEVKAPVYYDKVLENLHKEIYEQNKKERKVAAFKNSENSTRARLDVKHEVQKAKVKHLLKRSYEHE